MFSAVSSRGRANVDSARSRRGWRVASIALFGQMWASAMRKAGCGFTSSILCFVFAPKWRSLLYSIPHFCAVVKLKCDIFHDFSKFTRFLSRFLSKKRYARENLGLTVARRVYFLAMRSHHRSARACFLAGVRFTVARGPVPRERWYPQAWRGTGPRTTVEAEPFLSDNRSARACPSRARVKRWPFSP